jgi:hypothetical protein
MKPHCGVQHSKIVWVLYMSKEWLSDGRTNILLQAAALSAKSLFRLSAVCFQTSLNGMPVTNP